MHFRFGGAFPERRAHARRGKTAINRRPPYGKYQT